MNRVKDEVAALKRARIIDAATQLFYERGYANTKLDDVAELLGVTKPFLYSHAGNKAALLEQVSAIGIRRAILAFDEADARQSGPAETLRYFIPRYLTAILESQRSIAINIREEKNLEPAAAERLGELRQSFMMRVEALLERGLTNGEINVPDARIAAYALVGAVSWTTFWFKPGGTLSVEEVSDRMTRMFVTLARPEAQ
ncbi:HTH-type transcriptional repressor KstR2 [Rhodobacteraceae bacterium THAF1]|uniref:TetR/AcrR family transcriptional regulator n=1 Tax=Palleronia sp. THAF1 TaxID=2587842 RepID=UPI000F3C23D0|nr:TetR/AcrR family transcriptional regulator [Palleronia sp. THAF1]QFU08782.1 HTH-type transcriptional repressor KstR2 [Palleronia sp. THAF1]VDC31194.1 HTH-type transcriptional repressor KstR2 [Rhodobacteraceae bacterium THAF1]